MLGLLWAQAGAVQDAAPGHSSSPRAKSCSCSELPWVWTAGLGESKTRCGLPQKRGPAAPASRTKPSPLCAEQEGSCCSVLWELETCGHTNKTASKDLKNRHAFTDASARCFWALGFEFLRAPRKGCVWGQLGHPSGSWEHSPNQRQPPWGRVLHPAIPPPQQPPSSAPLPPALLSHPGNLLSHIPPENCHQDK